MKMALETTRTVYSKIARVQETSHARISQSQCPACIRAILSFFSIPGFQEKWLIWRSRVKDLNLYTYIYLYKRIGYVDATNRDERQRRGWGVTEQQRKKGCTLFFSVSNKSIKTHPKLTQPPIEENKKKKSSETNRDIGEGCWGDESEDFARARARSEERARRG